jgi:hypothetical protein
VAGKVVFVRGGNIYLLDLSTRQETAITSDGSDEYTTNLQYGCPTFLDADRYAFLEWHGGGGANLDPRSVRVVSAGGAPETLSGPKKPTGLGYDAPRKRILYFEQTTPGGESGSDWDSTLTLMLLPNGGAPKTTKNESWYGEVNMRTTRIRASLNGKYVSLPGHSTGVADLYEICRLDGEGLGRLLPDRQGDTLITSIDFGQHGAYIAVVDIHTRPMEPPRLYQVDVTAGRSTLLLEKHPVYDIAVSETLSTLVGADRSGTLAAIDLKSGEETPLGHGSDPDIWPK